MECGGLDTAFAQRGSTRWPGLDQGGASSRAVQSGVETAALHNDCCDACERRSVLANDFNRIGVLDVVNGSSPSLASEAPAP